MRLLTANSIHQLIAAQPSNAVSIFLPTEQAGSEVRQNSVRFRNLVRELDKKMDDTGFDEEKKQIFLKPARELEEDPDFWQNQDQGLAVFISESKQFFCRLPYNPGEKVVLLDSFYVKPVLKAIFEDRLFYLLALNQKQLSLYRGSRYEMEEVDLQDIPASIDDALRYDDPEKSLQYHTGSSMNGKQSARFHGQGAAADADWKKKSIRRFFQQLDNDFREKGYYRQMEADNAPLLLAGVEELIPIFKDACGYSSVAEEVIDKNPQEFDRKTLHLEAWKIMEKSLQQEKQAEADRFYDARSGNKTSADTEAVIEASVNKRVDVLFVDPEESLTGVFHQDQNRVSRLVDENSKARDLINFSILQTVRHGGQVVTLDESVVFPDGPVAALYRF